MGLVNHLRDKDGQNLFHNVAYGLHLISGNLTKSLVTGTSPTHVIKLQQMLGRGEWDGCEGLWWHGVEIESDKYEFYPGIQSTGMSDPTQPQDGVFDTDTPHSLVAWLRAELPAGLGVFDTKASPPEGLKGIFRTTKCKDYDEDGVETDYLYSTNPALQVSDLILRIGNRPTSRINWEKWTIWRDFLAEVIDFDYTALPNFDGFGLRGRFYNGTAFDTLVKERIDPVIEVVSTAGNMCVGGDSENFSVKWEGKIKALYSQTYTFYINHTHGAKLYVDNLSTPIIDQWATTGEHSATIALTAGSYYDIRVEWKHTTGNADFRLEWASTSQTREVINHRCLYPKMVRRARYETHPFFAGPTRLDDAVRTILNLCNSTVQEVDGKFEFFCLEQLTTQSYSFTNDKIIDGSVALVPRDVRNMRNSWQAKFRDIDSQYLDTPIDPVLIERPDLIELAGRKIDGEAIELFNCTVHQAYRTLDNIVRRACDSKYIINLAGNGDTYPVLGGDRVEVDIEFRDLDAVDCLVIESNDQPSEETADVRTFQLQQWPDFTTYAS